MTQDSIDLDLDVLEKVARAATPGPWHQTRTRRFVSHRVGTPHVCEVDCGEKAWEANSAHIATFDPPTVLKLIALARDHSRDLPEGWALVPREPTEDMIRAGRHRGVGVGPMYTDIYRAMISAAPLPSSQGGGKT